MDHPFQSPAILSLCTGIRGIERGLERVMPGIRTVAYLEIEAFCIENLVCAMEQGVLAATPVFTDIKTFPAKFFHNKIHGIIGGYPCQPFSLAGKRAGAEDPRHLWPHIARIIEATRPVWCFFENVDDHLSLGFDEVQRDLWRLGYAVEAAVFSAEETGAPHERKRLFILAIELEYATPGRARRLGNASGKRKGYGTTRASEVLQLAHTNQTGRIQYSGHISNGAQQFTAQLNRSQWPALPGQPQYEWEEPRTVEPGMGCTANGYNFREDILCALGNAVVEQTAAIAFTTLLKKFEITI